MTLENAFWEGVFDAAVKMLSALLVSCVKASVLKFQLCHQSLLTQQEAGGASDIWVLANHKKNMD